MSEITKRGIKQSFVLLIQVIIAFMVLGSAYAMNTTVIATQNPKNLQLVSGKSVILKSTKKINRVSVGIPVVVNFVVLSSYEIYLTGNITGTTNLIMWDSDNKATVFDIEVTYDISKLRETLRERFPEEKEVRVFATRDSLTVSGRISTTEKASEALELVEAYAGYVIKTKETKTKDAKTKETETKEKYEREARKVRNLLQVGGVHQVMIDVRVAEMSRTLSKRLGINFSGFQGGDFLIGTLGSLVNIAVPENESFISENVNAYFRFNRGSTTWTGFIDALRQDGVVHILAEPTLLALSGQTANFLVGGEFPYPVPQGFQAISLEWKEFGIKLAFTPTVLSPDKISINIAPEVSDLDFTNGVEIEGFRVPGLRTRRAATVVELADGQSFAIAGLLRTDIRNVNDKYPLLGDLPILGPLFQSKEFQKLETELIIIVTPHLAKPLDMKRQTLPTDFYIEPNDTEFYLQGLLEGRGRSSDMIVPGEIDGDFGHTNSQTRSN
jgi:pilus assembly protein CpaC